MAISSVVQNRIETLRELCARRRVKTLDLFGSATGDQFAPGSSDLDFLVDFEPQPATELAEAYFDLLDDLRDLFGRPVDLVMDAAIRNRTFRQQVDLSRVPLYGPEG